MPGSGPWQDPPGPPVEPAMVAARLDELESQAADYERRLFADIDRRLSDQEGQAKAVADRLEGAVGSRLAALEAQAGKVGAKLVKNANRRLGQAYTYMYPTGAVYPTNEQALYGLQTGDYLGSMGLASPRDSLAGAVGNDQPTGPVGLPAPVATVPTFPPVQPAPTLTGAAGNDVTYAPIPSPPTYPPATYPPPPTQADPGPPPCGVATIGQACTLMVSPYPGGAGYPVVLQPGQLLPVINPNNPAAPYGYLGGTGQVLCSNGGIAPHLGIESCGPGGGVPPAGRAAPPTPPTQPTGPPPGTTCPTGTTWTSYNPVTTYVPPVGRGAGSPAARSTPCPPGMPRVYGGWTQYFEPSTVQQLPGGATTYAPFLEPMVSPGQPPSVEWCVPDGCMDKPTGTDRVVQVGAGGVLYVNPGGWLVVGPPGLPSPEFYPVPGNACGVEGDFGGGTTGGGSCVPAGPVPASCPVPELPHCGPQLTGQLGPLTANEDDVCKAIADAIAKIQSQNTQVSDWIGMQTGDASNDSTAVAIMKAVLGLKNPIIAELVNRFAKWIQEFLKRGTNALGCDVASLLPIVINRGVFRLINHWTGAVPTQLLTELDQISNTVCQSLLPSVAEADRCYLADAIDQTLWECWVKAAGAHKKDAQTVRDAGRERLSVRQAIDAFRKEYITRERFDKLLRQGGVLNDDDKGELWQVEQYWPNHTDVITWMGKDAFDEDTVATFGLDTDFDQKYTARAKHYGDGMGLDDEQARYAWRAHWRNIGPQTMIEGARRLRPGDVDAAIAVSPDDLKKALLQQDIQPYWVDRMIELGYRVVTREDAVKLYTLHQIEEEDLTKLLQDAGFKKDKAEQLTNYYKTARDLAEVKASGVPTVRMAVRRYGRGEMTARELSELATQLSYYPGQVEQIEEAADLARDMENRRLAIAGVKRRYTKGLIGAADAAAELAGENIDADEITELMKWWDQVKKHAGKHVPAATLCTWRKSHLIGASEQLAALMRLGYDGADANHIVAQCTLDIANTAQRAQVKAEQQAMKAATQAAKTEAARMKAKVRSNRTSVPSANGGSANGAAGH